MGYRLAVSGSDTEALCRRRPVGEGWGQWATSEPAVIHSSGTAGEAESSAYAGRWAAAASMSSWQETLAEEV